MINSRKLEDLHPIVQAKAKAFLAACTKEGIDLLVTSTYRDHESQDALYAMGRTAPGSIVTNAQGGESFHNYRVALDVVPIISGKPIWNDSAMWGRIGALGEASGLEWAGKWQKFREQPHFQYTGGLTLSDFKAGKTLGKQETKVS